MSEEVIKNKVNIEKEKLKEIIVGFESYFLLNYKSWDEIETEIAHQILGTLIFTFKKAENLEKLLPYVPENQHELLDIEIIEIGMITEYYEKVFV